MSVPSEIDRINNNIDAAYNEVASMGGTVPAAANSANLAAAVRSIPQDFEETDPTVPSWAKAENKPTYTASEVGARPDTWMPTAAEVGARPSTWTPSKSNVGLGNVDNVRQYSASNPPPYPVTSVNGKTGAVTVESSMLGKTATLTVSKWTSNSVFGWQQTVTVQGVTASASQVISVDIALSLTDAAANEQMLASFAYVAACPVAQGTNQLTFYAVDKPTVNLSLAIGVGSSG